MLVLDCEVYQDYFLAAFMDDVGKVLNIELHD